MAPLPPPRRVVVFNGGEAPTRLPDHLRASDFVIAADSGLAAAATSGLHVDVVVGDFDSVDPALLDVARRDGTRLAEFPRDKDATDLELALDEALAVGATHISVVGGDGGRLDHLMASLLALGSGRLSGVVVEAYLREAYVTIVRHEAELRGEVGTLLTLLPIGGSAGGVRTSGLRWPLQDETLDAGSTRGVSNVFVAETVTVALGAGVLAVVAPHAHLLRLDRSLLVPPPISGPVERAGR